MKTYKDYVENHRYEKGCEGDLTDQTGRIGCFHIDVIHRRTAKGPFNLFVAIDLTSEFAFPRLMKKATQAEAADFLQALIEFIPYKIHTVITDHSIYFDTPGKDRLSATDNKLTKQRGVGDRANSFGAICASKGIVHYRLRRDQPLGYGKVERMMRKIEQRFCTSVQNSPSNRMS